MPTEWPWIRIISPNITVPSLQDNTADVDRLIKEIKKERYLSTDVNRLLRQWGYIQGKEAKEVKM